MIIEKEHHKCLKATTRANRSQLTSRGREKQQQALTKSASPNDVQDRSWQNSIGSKKENLRIPSTEIRMIESIFINLNQYINKKS
jgi:hypothetical protein